MTEKKSKKKIHEKYPVAIIIDDVVHSEIHDETQEVNLSIINKTDVDLEFLTETSIEKLRLIIRSREYIDFTPLSRITSLKNLVVEVDYFDKRILDVIKECKTLDTLRIEIKKDTSPLDLSLLENSNIRNVMIWSNETTSIVLPSIEKLEEITLALGSVSHIDITSLGRCHNLTTLMILSQRVVRELDLGSLQECSKLNHLSIVGTGLESLDLSPLKEITGLKFFSLRDNKLRNIDISPLENNKCLESIYLSENSLKTVDLKPLSNMQLKELHINRNCLEKISLDGIPKTIEIIDLSRNIIPSVDLEPLRESLLTQLDLSMNRIEHIDLEPLLSCDRLEMLKITGNPMSFVLEHIEELFERAAVYAEDCVFPPDFSDERFFPN